MANIVYEIQEESIKEVYTDKELSILLKKPNMKKCSFSEYSTWVIINFLMNCGCRAGTIRAIKIQDLNLDECIVRHTKTRKVQTIPLCNTMKTILEALTSNSLCLRSEQRLWYLCNLPFSLSTMVFHSRKSNNCFGEISRTSDNLNTTSKETPTLPNSIVLIWLLSTSTSSANCSCVSFFSFCNTRHSSRISHTMVYILLSSFITSKIILKAFKGRINLVLMSLWHWHKSFRRV